LQKLTTLQALRGFAAFMVLLVHAATIFSVCGMRVSYLQPCGQLHKAVGLFFVLSGCVMVYAHRADVGVPARYRAYMLSRFTRIFPLLWFVSLLAIAAYAAHPGAKLDKLQFGQLLCSVLLLAQKGPPLVNVSWVLVFELFFYFLFGVLILSRRIGLLLLVSWQVAIVVTWWLGLDTSAPAMLYLRPIALDFGLGMIVGWLITSDLHLPRSVERAVAWASVIGGVAVFLFSAAGVLIEPRFSTFGLASAVVVYGLAVLELGGRVRAPRLLQHLGAVSYSLFLINYAAVVFAVGAIIHFHLQPYAPVLVPVVLLLGVAAGEALHFLVEKPLGRALRRVLPVRSVAGVDPSPSVVVASGEGAAI
jgi:peptidoglycan/LPS O-acetylase OafA/YrhL